MKKSIYLFSLAVGLMVGLVAQAQTGDDRHRFEIGLASHYNFDHTRVGASGSLRWLLPTKHRNNYRFLLTAKATHTPAADGGFFQAFDNGKYDNISGLHLLAGYRINFFKDGLGGLQYEREHTRRFYVELSAGAGYVHHYGKTGPSVVPTVGYGIGQKVDLTFGYQGTYLSGVRDANLLELGLSYRF